MKQALFFSALILVSCGGGGESSNSRRPPRRPALEISGEVTTSRFALQREGSEYGDVSYIVETTSSADVDGCAVKVKWLDESGLQVSFTYAGTKQSIPSGTSKITDQHHIHKDIAAKIVGSQVEYRNCKPSAR